MTDQDAIAFSKCVEVYVTASSFWKSVDILLTKPHVVNKRLWGSKTIFSNHFMHNSENWDLPAVCGKLEDIENIQQYNILTFVNKELELQLCTDNEIKKVSSIEIKLIELLPKNYCDSHAFQLTVLRRDRNLIKFYDVTPVKYAQKLSPEYSFTLQWQDNFMELQAICENEKACQWLTGSVLTQFVKWAQEFENKTRCQQLLCTDSLVLVSSEKYYEKYNKLKLKYGKEMVQIWPECTDPSKFVYEDVAIATYLLLIWESERETLGLKKPQSFVDLGCGNGLLVYILTKEGYHGIGIDVRKRHIWDTYSDEIKLVEKTIVPSDSNLFPETQWIIGNHSDELTPWIPIIAARSSYSCNFFLLPCCAYNFNGSKYQRHNSSKSQYVEYLEYLRSLCEDCGFCVAVDRLKIPSTKRICLVSQNRVYSQLEYNKYCKKIQVLLDNETRSIDNSRNRDWISDFKPREQTEKVRNCTQIDKHLVNSIVNSIAKHLLKESNTHSLWHLGNTVSIHDLVQLIPENNLKALKSECGGIQTLLKNHHHIFRVQGGKVQLRYPKTIEEVNKEINKRKDKNKKKSLKLQQKLCWFHQNHPQGCPLEDNVCSYAHHLVVK